MPEADADGLGRTFVVAFALLTDCELWPAEKVVQRFGFSQLLCDRNAHSSEDCQGSLPELDCPGTERDEVVRAVLGLFFSAALLVSAGRQTPEYLL